MLYLNSRRLAELMREQFDERGVAPVAARHVVASVVETSLRGVDSHGINLFPHYCRAAVGGRVNPRPNFRLSRENKATAVLDADHGFGHHGGSEAMALAVERARRCGIGAVSVMNSTHFGAASYFGLQAAREGLIGLAFTNADALVRPTFAAKAFFGTNPVCLCAPMLKEEPFCLDMATSIVSWNKVLGFRKRGEQLQPGWAADEQGLPTLDSQRARMLEPTGTYKGYGLGMMVELLCGLLAGGPAARELLPMFSAPLSERRRISHFFAAIDISSFTDQALFVERLQAMADQIRALPHQEQTVMIPGDPEKKNYSIRIAAGIPIEEDRFDEFVAVHPGFREALMH